MSIERLGKFEGEGDYVPYYWEIGLDGGADDEIYSGDTPIWVFKVTPEDREEFFGLKGKRVVKLWEDEQGFVREW